ncbi:pol polyprotein [Aphelenchoides avenae]|nr:pol polyprotein [Aphelenchus avenae]
MAFPLILGTNCLSDLGFELINKHTGEELLSAELEPEGGEDEAEAMCPATTVFAAAPALVAPYQTVRLHVRAPQKDGTYLFTSSLITGTPAQPGLVDAVSGRADIWLTNGSSAPLIVDAGQELGAFETVTDVYTSSDLLSTDLLEELIYLSRSASVNAMAASPDRQRSHSLSSDERLQELLRLLGPTEMPLSDARRAELESTLLEFNDVFALNDSELGRTGLVKHKIELIGSTPVRIPPRPIPYVLREPIAEMVQDYYEREIIKPSVSSYSSPIVIARKKDQSLRFCVDYRILNSRTKKFAMPLPNIDYLLLTMGPKQFFSSLDLLGAYWQLELEEESKQYTAFPALNQLWEFNDLSFGLTNAPGTFQEFMQRLFDGVLNDYVYVFLDDILIVSSTWEEHLAHIREVFRRLRTAGLRLKPKKCRLVAREVQYLGHILSPDGLRMDPEKVAAVKNFPRPTCVRDVQSFHGLANHYRKFIKGFALIAHPLYQLIKKGAEFVWREQEEGAFSELKRVICEEVTLRLPDFEAAKNDPERPLTLQTDACRAGIAGILCQKDSRGALRPIHFVSRSTKGAELNYGITELEALSIKYSFNKLAPYLIGLNVRIETDHSALVQMFTKPRECGNARIDKWAMQLMSRFDFYVIYKPGKANAAADALSRHVTTEGFITVAVMTRRMAREAEATRDRPDANVEVEPPQPLEDFPSTQPASHQQPALEVEQPPSVHEGGKSWDQAMEESDFADVVRFLSQRELPRDPEQLSELLKSPKRLHFRRASCTSLTLNLASSA